MESDELHPDEIAAAEAAEADDPAARARGWLLATPDATLCTTAVQRAVEGFPYGSVVPFALTAEGHPVVLIAEIAAHTANLKRDPRASLFVRQPAVAGDPQAGWRITMMGRFERLVGPGEDHDGTAVSADVLDDLDARYLERVRGAGSYRDTHGFSFWRMSDVVKGRYIAGFGKICWIDGPALLRDPQGEGFAEVGPGAVDHMNDDHASSMLEMCTGLYGFTPASARMLSIDRTGFTVVTRSPDRRVYFPFGREIAAGELRLAVIDVLKRARAAR